MITSSIIRNILADKVSLREYLSGKVPSYDNVKRRLLLLLRAEDKNVPDHYYRLSQKHFLKGIDTMPQLLTKGLYSIANGHLEMINERIYVKQAMQSSWQELITQIPPLLLQMALLFNERPIYLKSNRKELKEYTQKHILPNVMYTALPHPYIPEIKYLLKKLNGFHDLHIHLNGSTETDIMWQDLMLYPQKAIKLHKESIENSPLAIEQIEQDFNLMEDTSLEDLLLIARRIREYLFWVLFDADSVSSMDNKPYHPFQAKDTKELIYSLISYDTNIYDGIANPFLSLVTEEQWRTPLYVEGLMYVLILCYLTQKPKESVAAAFHLYMLIMGHFNKILVQQKHDCGFEEFQKYTQNGIRDNSETNEYKTRFLQLCGNRAENIAFVEGRFSPQASSAGNESLISQITKGWENCWQETKLLSNKKTEQKPELKLIAHFIKKKEKKQTLIRHEKLRKEVWEKAYTLGLMKENCLHAAKDIVGIDAAASEFDAPPEVFAPSFRYLKRKGFRHFTYHAGEDFFHLIGGLRRIYEAVEFMEMSYGDRIGHATASGISPQQWLNNVGEEIFMHQGEYLDDLIFAYNLIIENKSRTLKHKIHELIIRIHELFYNIYSHSASMEIIIQTWKLRRLCPLHIFSRTKENAQNLSQFDDEEWRAIKRSFQLKTNNTCDCAGKINEDDEIFKLLILYHCPKFRKRYEEITKVNTSEIFNVAELEELQLLVLKHLHDKEIIIETLPTSNVRIGHHHTYDTYHLWNWIKWEDEGKPIPPIVVGTDDAGIFATNIYNEYANIYCNLVNTHKTSRNRALSIIEKLDKNAQIYKFT